MMLPTPSTSHVSYDRIYEPSEDSFFLIDAISSPSEARFLQSRFSPTSYVLPESNESDEASSHDARNTGCPTQSSPSPLILEVGTGSGVILAFLNAHAKSTFGRSDILAMGTDINHFAASAANKTVRIACADARTKWPTSLPTPPSSCPSPNQSAQHGSSSPGTEGPQSQHELPMSVPANNDNLGATTYTDPPHGTLLATTTAFLTTPLRSNTVSIILFNPPYVPSEFVPAAPPHSPPSSTHFTKPLASDPTIAEQASHMLALATDGGKDGMEVTWKFLEEMRRVLDRELGVGYLLLCKQNRPEAVMRSIRRWNDEDGNHEEHEDEEGVEGGAARDAGESGNFIWDVKMIAKSGYVAGWEKLCILRIWRRKAT